MHKPSQSNLAQWALFSFIIILLSGCLENVSFTDPCDGRCAAISNYGMSLPLRDKDPGEIAGILNFVKNKGYVLNGDFLVRWTRLDNQQNVIIIDDGFGERLLQESISIGSAQYHYFDYDYPDNTLIPSGTTHVTVYLRAPDGTETVEASIPLSVIGKAPQENAANSTTKKVTYAAKQLGTVYIPPHLAYFPVTSWIHHDQNSLTIQNNIVIEAVQIQLSGNHIDSNSFSFELISPAGNQALLFNHDPLLSYDFYGEQSQGEWNINLIDGISGEKIILEPWSIRFYGQKQLRELKK